MRKNLSVLFYIIVYCATVLLLCSCTSAPKVDRVSPDSMVDLSGRWNDTDVRLVCESLVKDCLADARVAQFIEQYASQHGGKLPACLVGSFRNESSDRIDTSIISINMETAIVNSGKFEFVAGGDTRQEIRGERQDQLVYASEATAAALGYETGAVLILTGTVRSIVDRAGNTTVRSYFVNAEMTNVQTNVRLWMGNNNEIKKVIRQPNYRF